MLVPASELYRSSTDTLDFLLHVVELLEQLQLRKHVKVKRMLKSF